MKQQFRQYLVSLLNIAAYFSMELFSFLETPKIRDLQPCANKRTYLTKTLEYGDDKKIFEFLEL